MTRTDKNTHYHEPVYLTGDEIAVIKSALDYALAIIPNAFSIAERDLVAHLPPVIRPNSVSPIHNPDDCEE